MKAKFIVDKPFIFFIYDRENDIPIFVGRIVDPNGKLKLQ
jgi:serine protease inhibitor